jgi:predicted Zn-dependent protease
MARVWHALRTEFRGDGAVAGAPASARSVYSRGMQARKSWGKAVLLLVALALAALAQKPSPGDNFYSLEEERKFGQSTASTLERMLTVVREPKLDAYVARLSDVLARHANSPFSYSFTLYEDRRHNVLPPAAGPAGTLPLMPIDAFQCVLATEPVAVAGGPIFIPLSLLANSPNEAVFAFQLAHAMAHTADRHATRFMTRTDVIVASRFSFWQPAIQVQNETCGQGYKLPMTAMALLDDFEKRADSEAVITMSQADYTPEAIAAYFAAQTAPKNAARTISTHPTPRQRAQAIRNQFAKLPAATYDAATGGFDEARALAATMR